MMRSTLPLSMAVLAMHAAGGAELPAFRPPAVPLVTVDPYTSVWSFSDCLYESWPVHWTGAAHAMAGMIRVDGAVRRFMGPGEVCPGAVEQQSVEVRPAQTVYVFESLGVELTVTFLTPMLADELALLSSPVTFVTFDARSIDGKPHDVALYFDASAEWVVNKPKQAVTWGRKDGPGALKRAWFASEEQPVLAKDGDDLRIDWGYLHVACETQPVVAGHETARGAFRDGRELPAQDDTRQPRAAEDDWPVIACAMDLGKVEAEPARRQIVLAYDDLYSIEYMGEKLRPWWFKKYGDFDAMLADCVNRYAEIASRCAKLDDELTADALRVGGGEYARLIELSYRHVFASGKVVVGPDGTPWFFHKECFSNGCTATVDVSYPASPFFALLSPVLLRGMMEPVFDFAVSDQWKFDFAPHDVGTYPRANGQRYNPGKIEGQMPVEECGNMLLMAALEARSEGNAKYAEKHWALLTQWAEYLKAKGLDPENQLCTDDFAGHLARNANLSMKAITALAGYAMLCEMLGKPEAEAYKQTAADMAKQWTGMADAGDHFKLTFDPGDTWSMKYNLVWDRLLGFGLFPQEAVADKEVAYYLKIQNKYGLPLDSRKDYTKSDWLVWCATLASNRADFEALVAPLFTFCNESPSRVPFTDWYDTKTAKCVGFRARPVIGGIFIKFLEDESTWKKWRERAGEE
ncbi:MAG: hypothetical protein QG656_277 [Candidatus Hydrogenedentes bacterium]|nr:hypothetical protein [Candidatus Hydrogenedentota bacterium]